MAFTKRQAQIQLQDRPTKRRKKPLRQPFRLKMAPKDRYYTIACKDLTTLNNSDTHQHGAITPEQLIASRTFGRYKGIYNYCRVIKMKVEFFVHDPILITSFVQFDDKQEIDNENDYERQAGQTLRLHRCTPGDRKYSRTLDLLQHSQYADVFKTVDAQSTLESSGYDAKIAFMAKNSGSVRI